MTFRHLLTFVSLLPLSLALAQDGAPVVAPEYRFVIPDNDDAFPGAGPVRRYDWMRNVWNERRSTFADRATVDRGAIVFFGDSITQGWGDDFGGAFDDLGDGVTVANRGISGDTTRGMLYRLDQDVLSLDPAGVVMLMGTNDLEEHAGAATIAGNVRSIIQRLTQHNADMPIVLCRVMPSSEAKARPADAIRAINAALATVAADFDQVTLVDTWTPFADENGNAKIAEFPDLLHPNAAGYAKWQAIVKPLLSKAGNGNHIVGPDYSIDPDLDRSWQPARKTVRVFDAACGKQNFSGHRFDARPDQRSSQDAADRGLCAGSVQRFHARADLGLA